MPLTKENAREFGKAGDRPKGRLSTSKKWSLREFAGMVVMDPTVQQRILKQARAGTLPPRVLVELFHYYGGPPPSEPELPSTDPSCAAAAERRARLLRLSKEERLQLATLLGRLNAPAPAGPGGGPAQPGHEAR